ncbi:hypothetical protein F4679DRAFT_591867 [Xylaria curta]|nr:hypothetical protein F4679DRAFT_591867 [Xylaria curta]
MASSSDTMLPPIDYHDDGPGMVASSSVLALLATIAVALRFWARKLTRATLRLDDYLILAALFVQHAQSTAAFASVFGGGLGRDFQLVVAEGKVVFLFKAIFASEILYGLSASIVKLAVLSLIWRIFPTREIRIVVIVLVIITICWIIAIEIVNFLQCIPLHAFWHVELQALPETKCLDFILFFLGNSSVNTVVDFVTLTLPIREILKLKLPRSKKIAICGIFLLGGITFAASLTRTISTAIIHNQTITNFTKQFVVSAVATVIEVYVAIIGACVPVLAPVYSHIRGLTITSSSTGSSNARAPFVKGLSYSSKSNLRRMVRPYDQLDDDLSTAMNSTTNHRVEISRRDFDRSEYTNNHAIPLQGIMLERATRWTENKEPYPE